MSPKNQPPDENQGTFFPSPQDLLTGAIKPAPEGEEAFGTFPEATQPNPDKKEMFKRLDAQKKALDNLAFESESDGHVQVNQGKLNQQPDAYGRSPEHESPIVKGFKSAIQKSRQAREDSWLWSQRYFAASVGVEVRLITRDKLGSDGKPIQRPDEKHPIQEPAIVTVEPDSQEAFDAAYAGFRAEYYGAANFAKLDAKRREITRELSSIQHTDMTAPDPALIARVRGILPPRP